MEEDFQGRDKGVTRGDIGALFLVREKALDFFSLSMQCFDFGACPFQVEFIK